MNAQKFFRIEVSTSWGHLIKERKTLTKPEETIKEAKRAQDNIIVQQAKKTLDSAIDEAYKSCLPEHGEEMPKTKYEKANRLYIQTLYKIHGKFADTIGQNWVAFMKDMETTWLTKKNT